MRIVSFAEKHDRLLLAAMMAAFVAVRSAAALAHSIPRLFPDEYIYAALGRSLAQGHLAVRGQPSLFPGVFEPLIAAPIWRAFNLATAYHLVQVENAVVASLAAIPVYLLARRLGLAAAYGLVCAFYALLMPALTLVANTQSDAVGYPLALGAIAAGVFALDQPTRRNELSFLVLTTAAAATRVEYFAIAAAFAASALLLDRTAAFRRHFLALLALLPAAATVVLGSVGYYDIGGTTAGHSLTQYVDWLLLQPYLLAIEACVVIVPGAVVAIVFARTRVERSFRWMSVICAAILLVESAKVAAETSAFKERYVFVLLPLLLVWFGVYVKNGRPRRRVVFVVSAALLIASVRLPLSTYATPLTKFNSQFLTAFADAEGAIGVANASLVAALAVAVLALAALATTRRGWAAGGVAITLAITLAMSVDAARSDIRETRAVRAGYARDLSWVDAAHLRHVTAIATGSTAPGELLVQLYWNSSITREVIVSRASRTDAFRVFPLRIGPTGALDGVSRNFLTADTGATIIPANARRVASATPFSLWRADEQPRLRALIEGRFPDGWLTQDGRLRFWPERSTNGVRATFRLALPASFPSAVHLQLGDLRLVIKPGTHVDVTCRGAKEIDARFKSDNFELQPQRFFRRVSIRLTRLRISDPSTPLSSGCVATPASTEPPAT